jgi:hypothetical protein
MDRDASTTEQPATYLVERYWPGIDEPTLRTLLPRLRDAADAVRAEGLEVESVATILMPADQVVFSLFSATSETAVRRVNELAALPFDRVAAAVAIFGGGEKPG